jgi:FMN reductase [NAD(P)H]
MEFRDVLAKRRMHRAFLPDPVPEESVERIVRTIRRAPSGGFSQGQSLVVVTDPHMRRCIAGAFEEEKTVASGFPPFVSTAPLHIVISANERLYHERYNEPDKLNATGGVEVIWPVPYWFVDAGALMILIQLAAIDEGLASAFIGHPDQKRIFDDLLGLPADVVPIGLCLIGRPAPDEWSEHLSSRLAARRRPLDDFVHRGRWAPRS